MSKDSQPLNPQSQETPTQIGHEQAKNQLLSIGQDVRSQIAFTLDVTLKINPGIWTTLSRKYNKVFNTRYKDHARSLTAYNMRLDEIRLRTTELLGEDASAIICAPLIQQRDDICAELEHIRELLTQGNNATTAFVAIGVSAASLIVSFAAFWLTQHQFQFAQEQDKEMKGVIKQFDDRVQAQIGLMEQLNVHTKKQLDILGDQDKLMRRQLEVVENQIRLDQAIRAQKPDLTLEIFHEVFPSSRTDTSKEGIPLMLVITNKGTREAQNILFNFWIPSSVVITSLDDNLRRKAETADAVIDGNRYTVIRGREPGPIFSIGEGTKVGSITVKAPPGCYEFRWKLATSNTRFPAGESFEKLKVPLGAACI